MPISTPAHSKTTDLGKCACGWVSPKLTEHGSVDREASVGYSLGQHIARSNKKLGILPPEHQAGVGQTSRAAVERDAKADAERQAEADRVSAEQAAFLVAVAEAEAERVRANSVDEAALVAKRAKAAEAKRRQRAAKKAAAAAAV
jgi:hypothetical protein